MRSSPATTWDRLARLYDLQLWLERPALDRAAALADVASGERLLDVATGTGALLRRLAHRPLRPAEAVGVDASRAMLARARALPDGWDLVEADARALAFADTSFDVVTAAYLLHTLDSPARGAVLTECHRVLRPDGRLVTVTVSQPRSRVGARLAGPIISLARRSSGTLAGLRPLDPRPEIEAAGFTVERALAVSGAGYPSLCVLARVAP
ncbi:MAG: class I SAM-dependent methyltransferase [Thermoleophilaceae bacterium]|nr:class I SAM-dependent methyltransferase [Thermoleophilaceae bacterium]